jgi:hypothetical protein
MTPDMVLAIAVATALAAAALRAAATRPKRPGVPGFEAAPVTVTAGQSQPRPTVTAATHDRAVRHVARPPRPPARPAHAVEQAQHIFHELHADGRNTFCSVCDSQYSWGAQSPGPPRR